MIYQVLKVLHVTALALTFMGLAGVLGMKLNGDGRTKHYWLFFVTHGIGLLLLLASGFALVSKLGLMAGGQHLPLWVQAKLFIWLCAGGAIFLAACLSRHVEITLLFFTVLVALAAWLAIAKPF
jgi:hypothetical protein